MKYRVELVTVCWLLIFAGAVAYDTLFVIERPVLRTLIAGGLMACLGATLLLVKYPIGDLHTAIWVSWPLHLFTLCFWVVSYWLHGGWQFSSTVLYTIVGYLTYLHIPFCLLTDRRWFEALIRIIAVGSACLAVPSFAGAMGIDSLGGIPLRNKESYSEFSGLIASGGIFEHPEGHALQMAVGLCCAWYLWRKSGGLLDAVYLLATLGGLVVSQGRGAIFGVLAAGVFATLPPWFFRFRLLFVGGLLFTLIFPFLILPQLAAIPGVSGYFRLERGLSGRDAAWAYAITLVEEEPWRGHGQGSSSELSEAGKHILRSSGYSGAGTTFHNTFLTKAVELGVLAAGVYLLLYLVPLYRICEPTPDHREQLLIRSVVIVAVIASVFRDYNIGGIRSTSIMVSVFLGLASLWPWLHARRPIGPGRGGSLHVV